MLALFIFAACTSSPEAPAIEKDISEPETPQPVNLFNGVNLEGWSAFLVEPDAKKEDVWSVQDGILVCKGEPLGYLYTDGEHESFRLIVEWRWAPGTEPGNSGVLMRISGEPKGIPRAIEAQLMSGNAGDLYGFHGLKIDGAEERKGGGEAHELLGDFVKVGKIEANENEPGQWNTYDITLDGPNISVKVNGKLVNEAKNAEILSGPIGFQSEGGEIHFRQIQLIPLA
jgi:hypothetical protein